MLRILIKKWLTYLRLFFPQLHIVYAQWTNVWSLNYWCGYWSVVYLLNCCVVIELTKRKTAIAWLIQFSTTVITITALKRFNPKKVAGPVGVPNWLLREYEDDILVCPVTAVLNGYCSFVAQRRPSFLKMAHVTDINKHLLSQCLKKIFHFML